MEGPGRAGDPQGFVGPADPGRTSEPGRVGGGPSGPGGPAGPGGPGGLRLPLLPGFREMALRRMAAERRQLVKELAQGRKSAGLSQTEVAARMGTSQSAV